MKNVKNKLRVVHIPQVPMDGFTIEVKNEREAFLIEETLANQHLFLYENDVIPDYSNVICVEMWDDELEPDEDGLKWTDYYNEEEELDWENLKETYINILK